MPDPRRQLLQLAADLLSSVQGRVPDTITVTVRGDGAEVTLTARPGEFRAPELSELHRSILAAAGPEPKSAKTLARLSGHSYSPRFRGAVADLVRAGLLVRVPEGLRLA